MPRPLPASAVSIFTHNDQLIVQFPLPLNGGTGEVSFRNSPSGFMALWRFLAERERAFAAQRPALFGTPAAPIQHIVDTWQKDPASPDREAKAKERAAKARQREIERQAREAKREEELRARALRYAEAERFKSKPVKEQLADLSNLFDDPDFEI